ncbi:MAG TPA: HAMP domain-containing sensor histidine kinase [Flavisolibacter sp.]
MELLYQKINSLQGKVRSIDVSEYLSIISQKSEQAFNLVRRIGFSTQLDEYEKRKLGIFNLLNFFHLLTGISIAIAGVSGNEKLSTYAWVVACFPALNSALVLSLNYFKKHESALLAYFLLQPFFTCVVYLNGLNLGLELFFILYGILSVFFLRDFGYMAFSIAFSMISFFVLSVFSKSYQYSLASSNMTVFLVNQALAIVFIFYGLFLIRKENTGYQYSILDKNQALHEKNAKIRKQNKIISEKAALLKTQADELGELNTLKTKLFSVIAHDLKTPMYALRTLFRNVQQQKLPAKDIKLLIPDVVNDLNYTISLMENLLQWSKSQMQSYQVQKQEVDVKGLINEVVLLLRLQAESKKIHVEQQSEMPLFISADKDMINLVLRNLLSNAIKFTPNGGQVSVGLNDWPSSIEVYVEDSGIGISNEALHKIGANAYYTTNGTASESGTGLGLMLCKEFLARNGGEMLIASEPGKGSRFSFTIPKPG